MDVKLKKPMKEMRSSEIVAGLNCALLQTSFANSDVHFHSFGHGDFCIVFLGIGPVVSDILLESYKLYKEFKRKDAFQYAKAENNLLKLSKDLIDGFVFWVHEVRMRLDVDSITRCGNGEPFLVCRIHWSEFEIVPVRAPVLNS